MSRRALFWAAVALFIAAAVFGWASGAFAEPAHIQHREMHAAWINKGDYRSIPTRPGQVSTHCCGPNDCGPLDPSDVSFDAKRNGFYIKSLNEFVPLGEAQISEDSDYWRCKRYDGTRRCFFYPPGNS